ncbi:hypothetical protein [Streptomyces sp. NPDC004330]|uniref:hypothetical protein n=1 Tax=Streptomyces sp. NPDC004330 TaxID=3364700 RepID=UPI0036B91C24
MATRSSKPADEPEQKADASASDGVAAAVQRRMDEGAERGLLGVEVDPTPNEHYTVAGVTEGLPTPETDTHAAAEAKRASQGKP